MAPCASPAPTPPKKYSDPETTLMVQNQKPSQKHAYIILIPLNPLLFSKTGVDKSIHFLLGGSKKYPRVPTIVFEQK